MSRFPICVSVGSTPVRFRGGIGYQKFGTCRKGVNRESTHIHALALNFLSTALKSKSDKRISHTCTSPREAWDTLLAWYGPQTTGAKSDLSRRLNSFKIGPGSNPLEEVGRIEDLAAEKRTAGITLDDHMPCTVFIDALPAEYEVGARNLASRDSIGRDDIIKAVREWHHRLSGRRKKGFNAGHADHAMFAGGGDGGHRSGAGGGAHGKGGGRGKEGGRRGRQGCGGKGTNEDGGGPAAAAGGDGSIAKTADGGTSEVRCHTCGKKGRWRVDCTEELRSRCHGRGYAADVCPTSKEEAVLAASDGDDDYDTVEASAFKARETGECSNVSGKKGKGESAWQVGDEAWLCDRGASTHTTPSADGMINYRECNLKLRIADGSTRTIEGYGDINFVFRSGNGLVQVTLTNVAHVRYHLFSLPTLAKNGHNFEGRPVGIRAKLKSERSIVFPLAGNLYSLYGYRVDCSTRGDACAVGKTAKQARCQHKRLPLRGRTLPRGIAPQDRGAARDRPRGKAAGVQRVLHGEGSPPRYQAVHTHSNREEAREVFCGFKRA